MGSMPAEVSSCKDKYCELFEIRKDAYNRFLTTGSSRSTGHSERGRSWIIERPGFFTSLPSGNKALYIDLIGILVRKLVRVGIALNEKDSRVPELYDGLGCRIFMNDCS